MKILVNLLLTRIFCQSDASLLQQKAQRRLPISGHSNYILNTGTVESGAVSVKSTDFDAALSLDRNVGYPGLKIRINMNAFRYASILIAQNLDREIRHVRIPPFSQCLKEVNGCAYLSNILITGYRRAQRISLFPVPYNRISLNIENFAVSLSGQLGGQIVVLLPIPLCGTMCVDARQISISVQMAVASNPYSGINHLQVTKCAVTIGYLNIYIVNGGLIGDIINNNFRGKIIDQARAMLPSRICGLVPSLVNEKVNPYLASLPRAIPLMQMISYMAPLTSKVHRLPQYCYTEICQRHRAMNISSMINERTSLMSGVAALNSTAQLSNSNGTSLTNERFINSSSGHLESENSQKVAQNEKKKSVDVKIKSIHLNATQQTRRHKRAVNASRDSWYQCAGCDNTEEEVMSHLASSVVNRIRARASDIALSMYLLGTYATYMDFTLNLLGEFSPNARGGTPFAPPIFNYMITNNARMFDLLISDYTINTLLYHLHRKGIFAFRIGREIPSVGDILNITCAGDDSDFDLSVEMDDDSPKPSTPIQREKRQSGVEALRNLGVCFGDIAPAIREKNPGSRVYIMIKTAQAPSVHFRAANGGTIITEFVVDGLIFLDGTATKVGHIWIAATIAVITQPVANQIFGKARIERLKFIDIDGTFGLPQDAFDNLADLARGTITKVLNNKLADGLSFTMPQLDTPFDLRNTYVRVVERALLVSTDISVKSTASSNRDFRGIYN